MMEKTKKAPMKILYFFMKSTIFFREIIKLAGIIRLSNVKLSFSGGKLIIFGKNLDKMKKIVLLIMLFSCFWVYPQFNPNAPWMVNNAAAKSGQANIDDLVTAFNQYWSTRDYKKKGSGYKPFKRWEYHWRNNTNPQGFLITPREMWNAFNEKNSRLNNRNNSTTSSVQVPVSNWEPLGPFSNATPESTRARGRVNTILVDPSNPNIVYMGTPAGGIWKSTNAGTSWTAMSDNLPQIGVSGIAVDYNNSNVIYIATGDCDANDTYSVGVMKSIDGGVTWNTTGLTFATTNKRAGDIIINPTNSNMLWCATSDGVYKTIDAGANWTLSQAGNFAQGRIRLKPGDPNTVYAVTTNKFYRSTNAGTSFIVNLAISGLPSTSGRFVMDVTSANSNYIYILSATTANAFQGIYRSVNGGTNWTKMSGTTDIFENTQSWYDLSLGVSQTNADELYTGCLNVWKSTNGGVTSTKLNDWATYNPSFTHADVHYIRFFGNKLFVGSDGGIYLSEDNGVTFTDKTAEAQISQIYKISVSKQTASKVSAGFQDNGGYFYDNSLWKSYHGGDGMDTAIDPTNSNLCYGFLYNGQSLFISNNGGNSLTGGAAAPAGQTGNWVTPMIANSVGELFSGFANLYILTAGAWVQQSVTSFGTGNIDYLAVDPSNDNIMYAANGGSLYKSTDRGINFVLAYSAASAITSIDVHSSDSNIVYLTTQGTAGLALKSINGGTAFTSISQGLPNIGKNIIVHQGRNTDNPLYVGTSLGVYYRDDTMTQFEPFDTNLPNVSVTDLEINLEDSKIIASTYGRGVWQSSIPVVVPSDDIKLVGITSPTYEAISCDGQIAPQIYVKNNGTNTISTSTINYTLNAIPYSYNWSGTISPLETIAVNLPQQTLGKGAYAFAVNSTIPNDAFNDNNTGTSIFFINDAGTVNVTNAFESAATSLLDYNEGSTSGLWTRGIRTGSALASFTNVYTTNTTGNYPDLTRAYLVSQCYDLTSLSNPEISFKMSFDLEVNWDIVYVEYSTDLGQSWHVLGQQGTNWYNSNRTPQTNGNDCYNCVGAQWTGTDTTLRTYNYSLASLGAPANIIFRFVFQSDESVNQLGVVVDDFLIGGTLANQTFDLNKIVIYPNPSTGIYTIFSGNVPLDELEVFDITGKVIVKKKDIALTNNSATLNLTSLSDGVYFVRITSENQTTVKRIIKN